MREKIYRTGHGDIHYWINEENFPDRDMALVFLPGLTADHRLFEKQTAYFKEKYLCIVWDAPEHAASWPFDSDFDLSDKARWLDEILAYEGVKKPVIVGQSMGGYVGQMYSELFPEKLFGFVCIDSAPLQREYMTSAELKLLEKVEPVYRWYPWKALVRDGARGTARSEYGRKLMADMMHVYDNDKERYVRIAGHGYRMLAKAIRADLPYEIKCPALFICGEKDMAGSTRRYNRTWQKKTGWHFEWIPEAGHNSNTDRPDIVNGLIEEFVGELK